LLLLSSRVLASGGTALLLGVHFGFFFSNNLGFLQHSQKIGKFPLSSKIVSARNFGSQLFFENDLYFIVGNLDPWSFSLSSSLSSLDDLSSSLFLFRLPLILPWLATPIPVAQLFAQFP